VTETNIKRLSMPQAEARAEEIARCFAHENRIEGSLLKVGPDVFESERRGKMPVHWFAVFENVIAGQVFDGPLVYRLNLETGDVKTNP
jgi:hypothetical protein